MTPLAPFAPAPVIDLLERQPIATDQLFWNASHDPESTDAASLAGPPLEPKLQLVISHEPVPNAPIIMIPAADFAAILAAIDALRAQLLSYQK